MQKFWSLIFYMLVALCCVTQTVSEAKEEGSEKESWHRTGETVIYMSNAPTKVTVIGNSILVPVTLDYQGNQLDVRLLLDTGSSGTIINTEIADRLNVNLNKAKKTRGRVVGGAFIEARQVTLSRIIVGPHAKEKATVFVVAHEGPAAHYDGLLGMDILRGLKYQVDLEKQIIIWE